MTTFAAAPPPPERVTSGARSLRGLDLLGLRAPVQFIGNSILDGVTTISPMVRYLGLRAWILRRYAEARLPDSESWFRDFAGRVEAAIVLGNLLVDPKATGLVGAEDASRLLDGSTASIDLVTFVKQLATSIYTGPSDQLSISYVSDGEIAGLTAERGLSLYQAVESSLGASRFAQSLQEDPLLQTVDRAMLEELGIAFPIGEPSPEERGALLAAILPVKPVAREHARLATYGVLLELVELLGREFSDESLFDEAVLRERRVDELHHACLDRWLVYLVRDMLAVVHECAFRAIVDRLSTPGFVGQPVESGRLLADLLADSTDHGAALKAVGLTDDSSSPFSTAIPELQARIQRATYPRTDGPVPRWDGLTEIGLIRAASQAGQGVLALLPVAWFLAVERLEGVRDRAPFSRLLNYNGYERFGVFEVVQPAIEQMLSQGVSLGEASLELAHRTVEQHLRMAWARLGTDPLRDVSVIAADGDRWRLVEGRAFASGRTASRLKQAIGWLRQLSLIAPNGLTTDGRDVLDRLRLTLAAAPA